MPHRFSLGFLPLGAVVFPGPAPVHAQQWGDVKGRIVWADKNLPKRQVIDSVKNNPDKAHCLMNGDILDEKWVVNEKNKGLRYSFVWLVDAQDIKAKLPIHPDLAKPKDDKVVIDQPCCMFVPHAIGMREGQVLLVKNPAPVTHNFKWTGNPALGIAGNVSMPSKFELPIKGLVADRLPIKIECSIHPWMNGWVRVFDHPYFAVTDENGAFTMPKAPAGDYKLVIWHGSGGFTGGAKGRTGQPIAIAAGKMTDPGELQYVLPEE